MMKEDITQQSNGDHTLPVCCGLVMKEDITQHQTATNNRHRRCGLVMKEDITQLFYIIIRTVDVVVW